MIWSKMICKKAYPATLFFKTIGRAQAVPKYEKLSSLTLRAKKNKATNNDCNRTIMSQRIFLYICLLELTRKLERLGISYDKGQ